MKLRDLLADALGFLLDPVFRLLEGPLKPFVFKWPRGDEKWECSADWMADAAAMGLYPYPAWRVAAFQWTPDSPFARPGLLLLILRIPGAPPGDAENHPIRAPPGSTQSQHQ